MSCASSTVLASVPAVVSAGSTVASGIGKIMSGNAAADAGGAQASFYDSQAIQTQVQANRAQTDLTNEKNATLASARATSAAGGGDIDTGIVSGIAGRFGDQSQRITDDANARVHMLAARALYARKAGDNASTTADIAGVSQVGAGLYSLYSSTTNPKPASYDNIGQLIQAKNIT